MNFISEELENYCEEYSVSDDMILKSLVDSTIKNEELPHMLCGPLIGGLLQLLIQISNSKNILEIGTSLGISTVYLSTAVNCSKVTTLEGCENTSNIALNSFDKFNFYNIKLVKGNFNLTLDEVLEKTDSFDLIFFDGNHNKIDTLNYFNKCLKKINSKSIFVFDDINWSIEMKSAWNQIIKNDVVTLSFTFLRVGVLFFKKDLQPN